MIHFFNDKKALMKNVSLQDLTPNPGAEEYFIHFLKKNPRGEVIQEEVQTFGTDVYLHSGMYNFEVGPGDGRHVVEARFSFVWKRDDTGAWKIIHHHSSAKPKI